MPIRPENRARYGADWPEFSRAVRFDRAQGRCECGGECGRGTHEGRCPNRHKQPAYGTGSLVVLTVAHLCHTPECREHVKAMCQGCHLHYDREHHARTRAARRFADVTFMTFKDADAMAVAMGDAPSVWDASLPPGGYVCGACGVPVESEPCREHQPYASGGYDRG